MKLKVTDTFEVTAEEIGEAFGLMDAGDQAELFQAFEEGLLKACGGDIEVAREQYEAIAKELKDGYNVTGIEIVPENLNP